MTDSQDVLAIMALVSLTATSVIWSNASLHGGWTGEALFFAVGLGVSGSVAYAGVLYKEWVKSDE